MELSNFAKQLLKDASQRPSEYFDFSQGSDHSWNTPYGHIKNPQQCYEIKNDLETLQNLGLIRELQNGGSRFEITQKGVQFAETIK